MSTLFERADAAIREPDPEAKADFAIALRSDWDAGRVDIIGAVDEPAPIGEPGRPSRPELVAPRELVQRNLSSLEGRAALVHAIAHIEFNAINLALDAVYRFRDMPRNYYGDWLRVAAEEANHFRMLRSRLHQLDYDYGEFPAHNGLWEMCIDTAHDVLVRMALVPRVLEARGLDVTPGMIERLQGAGDGDTVALLEVILAEEEGHVAIGSHWFRHCCDQRGLEPEATFRDLLQRYMRGRLRGPFNRPARLVAGFSEAEMDALERMDRLAEDR
ncbi:ferritin-like domain-containing protein [Methylonatrum kenyense]|uniref:ferritin-like domain-containing protein n=1 Tax=Methylonatrum kenyense TaxID=455253 RepID=UPI0020C0C620|nr:ferritin-like domain-containing protein [Methylonatrum kenyense]MCK8514844.1 ferritin-like domain-containing protein [Methylonatrum kenyense]